MQSELMLSSFGVTQSNGTLKQYWFVWCKKHLHILTDESYHKCNRIYRKHQRECLGKTEIINCN